MLYRFLPVPVAFIAHFHKDVSLNIGTNSTIKFDTVVTNLGQGYDPDTGLFTAPFSGLYSFFFSIEHDNQHDYIHLGLMAAGRYMCYSSVNGPSRSHYDEGTGGATAHPSKGETVFVQRYSGDYYIHDTVFSSFSGFLVSADV